MCSAIERAKGRSQLQGESCLSKRNTQGSLALAVNCNEQLGIVAQHLDRAFAARGRVLRLVSAIIAADVADRIGTSDGIGAGDSLPAGLVARLPRQPTAVTPSLTVVGEPDFHRRLLYLVAERYGDLCIEDVTAWALASVPLRNAATRWITASTRLQSLERRWSQAEGLPAIVRCMESARYDALVWNPVRGQDNDQLRSATDCVLGALLAHVADRLEVIARSAAGLVLDAARRDRTDRRHLLQAGVLPMAHALVGNCEPATDQMGGASDRPSPKFKRL